MAFYVRPDSTHGGANDGTSYADAWQGWTSIVWASLTGDKLYFCGGRFTETAVLTVGAHSSVSGSELVLTGDTSDAPDAAAVLNPGALTSESYINNQTANLIINTLPFNGNSTSSMVFSRGTDNFQMLDKTDALTLSLTDKGINFSGDTGQNHSGFYASNFYCTSVKNAVFYFQPPAANVATLDGFTVVDSFILNTSVVSIQDGFELRTELPALSTSYVSDVNISRNNIYKLNYAIRVINDNSITLGVPLGTGFVLEDNIIDFIGFINAAGACSIGGFKSVSGDYDGTNVISGNTLSNIHGNIGGFNLFVFDHLIVEQNIISNLTTNDIDGCAILVDHTNTDMIIRLNQIDAVHGNHAVNPNSGAAIMVLDSIGIEIYANRADNVSKAFYFGAGPGQEASAFNNTFTGVVDTGIYISPTAVVADLSCKNSIFVGETGSQYINNLNGTDIDEDYNCYFGFDVADVGQTIGSNSINENPLFVDAANGDYNLQESSPCVGVGVKWWGNAPRPESLSGEPLPDTEIDLGAYQSTWSPNHPKNL